MAKAPRRSFDLAKVIESELVKTQPMEIVIGDKTITCPPPILWPDTVFTTPDVESLHILLGDENYEAYVAAGGTTRLFFQRIVPDWQGATVPESQASTDS